MSESPIERLIKTNPDMEIWWDSSPLMFEPWVQKMLQNADPAERDELEQQLRRLYNAQDPAKSIFRGCTTNPPLSWEAVRGDFPTWSAYVDKLIEENPDLDNQKIAWLTYK